MPSPGGGNKSGLEPDRLSYIGRAFNDLFRNVVWKDRVKIGEVIKEEQPTKVTAEKAY